MKITQQQFADKLKNNELIITMIGMSNIGKTTWSKKLAAEQNFEHINIDHLLSQKVEKDLAGWLGQPYEEKFPARQQQLKDLEKQTMDDILYQLESGVMKNTVVDTPGSIIYTGAATCHKMQQLSLVVYIKATDDMLEQMLKYYFTCPKPLLWNDVFNKQPGEDNLAALKRCYPLLLEQRDQLYQQYADVIIPYPELDCETKNSEDFFHTISSYL